MQTRKTTLREFKDALLYWIWYSGGRCAHKEVGFLSGIQTGPHSYYLLTIGCLRCRSKRGANVQTIRSSAAPTRSERTVPSPWRGRRT